MTPAPAAPRRAPRAAGGMAESLATPRHRSSGNISVVPPADGCGVQPAESSRRGIGCLRTARRRDAYDLSPSPGARARLAAAAQTCSLHDFCREWRGPLGVLTALLLAFMIGAYCGQQRAAPADADAGGNFSAEPEGAFARLSEERLKNITSNLAMLQGLHKVVVKADDTYEEVYHNQLVRHSLDDVEPDEKDWNSFVLEARTTGPLFLDGKECLRDAVANMHRLSRRAPDYLRSLLRDLKEENAEEASWYLTKVVKLVDSIKESMERAAEKFGEVDSAVGGMSRDARENEQHLEKRASKLIGEAKYLELAPPARSGSWAVEANVALYRCQLGKAQMSLEECKLQCVNHDSGACTQITYYKTSAGNNCYFHCESATRGRYAEADVFALEKAPQQFVVDIARKKEGGLAAEQLQGRWRSVQGPLSEVTNLVRRFRLSTTDLRKSLEEVRFASGDLQSAVDGPSAERHLRSLERLVGDLVESIEDLGGSLAPMRASA